jgi:hypothetical protein
MLICTSDPSSTVVQTGMRAPTYEELREALHKALEHLDYCGWGDSWERECSEQLRVELLEIDARAYRLPPPDMAVRNLQCHWRPETGYYVRLADLSDALGVAPGTWHR